VKGNGPVFSAILIVSNTFTKGEWEADYKITTEENCNSWNEAHLWIIPAKVEGTWKSEG